MTSPVDHMKRPLLNIDCPYCGVGLTKENATKEHVVGRAFVPKGTLNGSLNVILRACGPCNHLKSDLEDDLSALSMHPDLGTGFTDLGDAVKAEAERKLAKSRDRATKKLIVDSFGEHKISGPLGPGGTFSMSFVSPPQFDRSRVADLARLHVLGFFYALTYDPATQTGRYPVGVFLPVDVARRNDWGSPTQRWFMAHVLGWHERIVGFIANDHFGVAIRRAPGRDLWSFAFEWNRSTRVIGFFGDEEATRREFAQKPEVPMTRIGKSPDGGELRMRFEQPIREEDDMLFHASDTPPVG